MDGKSTVRPTRNRRINRSWSPLHGSHRQMKKLFTPDIKRRLKQWLVERRENPYPTRMEKKDLAGDTGLTYIQICNWFANWRRKLKNTTGHDREPRKTWNHLIQNYNSNAKGNVEQLPLTDDEEEDDDSEEKDLVDEEEKERVRTSYSKGGPNSIDLNNNHVIDRGEEEEAHHQEESRLFSQRKYKTSMMEKYFQGEGPEVDDDDIVALNVEQRPQLMKWIESTTRFTPDKFNYAAVWDIRSKDRITSFHNDKPSDTTSHQHQIKELEAAEALTSLSVQSY